MSDIYSLVNIVFLIAQNLLVEELCDLLTDCVISLKAFITQVDLFTTDDLFVFVLELIRFGLKQCYRDSKVLCHRRLVDFDCLLSFLQKNLLNIYAFFKCSTDMRSCSLHLFLCLACLLGYNFTLFLQHLNFLYFFILERIIAVSFESTQHLKGFCIVVG